jgi:peptidyl-prolyl cis-trans isomerase B (cyclophilin B)
MSLSLTGLFLLAAATQVAAIKADTPAPTHVTLDTNKGKIVLELYPDKAPKTVANFIAYVKSGYYDGTIFHRVVQNFMIQGGWMDAKQTQKKPREPIQNEADNGLKNQQYTIAMARTGDPHSASAQFFINLKDNDFLNFTGKSQQGWGYAVFGKVISGTEVVDAIGAVPVQRTAFSEGLPLEAVVIKKATVGK